MKANLLFAFSLCVISSSPLFSQTTIGRMKVDQYPVSEDGDMTYGLTWVPPDYNPANKYPLIIFMHGSGEGGDGVNGLYNLLNQGLPWWIARGFSPSAVNPVDKKTYQFIVVNPQAPGSWRWSYNYDQIRYILPDIIKRYSIDPSRIYITGLSAGGSGTWSCVTDDETFARQIAAIMPNSDAGLNNTPAEEPHLQDITSTYGVPVWCVDGALDGLNGHTTVYLNTINAGSPAANPQAVQTLIPGAGHSAAAWDSAYSPTWRNNQFGLTAYEWLLKYNRGGVSSPTPPTANAGAAQTITLPVSNATLAGSGSPASGKNISSFRWTQISGPSTATLGAGSSASAAVTTVTALVEGTYTFQLTVKDNAGLTATSTVTITVNAAINLPPIANAGSNQTITLPVNSVTLVGSAMGNAGTLLSLTTWSLTSGPNTAKISSPSLLTTTVTGLVAGTYVFKLTVLDILGLSVSASVTITVNPAASSGSSAGSVGADGYTPIPAVVQAENYTTMSGIQTENTMDANGGLDVGWIDPGDYLNYNVQTAAAGTYTVSFRVASPQSGGILQLKNTAGAVLATVNVPQTGSWQTWQTVTASVTLPAGNQTLQVCASTSETGLWNFNWLQFESTASNPPPPPPLGQPIPGIVQAESYDDMTGVQTETTLDDNGGLDVGWIHPGDYMSYNVSVATAGAYTAGFRVASPQTGGILLLKNAAGATLATVTVPLTGSWQSWQTVTATINLPVGNQTLQVIAASNETGLWNFNWVEFKSTSGTGSTTPPPPPPTGQPIPGLVEAESYAVMSGIQTESTLDANGGLDVGWIDPGDYMNYSVSAASAGTYTVSFRVASPQAGGILLLKNAAGATLATVNVPWTGNWQAWQTVTATVNLPAGNQTLQVVAASNETALWNFNWMDFEQGGTGSAKLQTTALTTQQSVLATADSLGSTNTTTSTNAAVSANTATLSGSTVAALTLYPNPARDYFMLSLNNNHTGKMNIQVIDRSGKISKTYLVYKDAQTYISTFSIGTLPAGVYSIRIQIGDWHDMKKLLKL